MAPLAYQEVNWDVPGSVKRGLEEGVGKEFAGLHKGDNVFDHETHASAVVCSQFFISNKHSGCPRDD